jgi:DNA polymerase I-like protein with 3'-5' exonuclease and polymerase domains
VKNLRDILPGTVQDNSYLPWFLQKPSQEHYLDTEYIVFDFETTNLEKGNPLNPMNSLVSVAWYDSRYPEEGVRYERGNHLELPGFRVAMGNARARKYVFVAHNAKFEIQWLHRMGIQSDDCLWYDTMIGEYVLAGNRKWRLNLDETAKRWGRAGKANIVDTLIKSGVCPSEIPEDFLQARAMLDVKDTLHVFHAQRDELLRQGKLAVMFTRCITTPVLAMIELEGVGLDEKRVREEYEKSKAEYMKVLREFNELTGGVNPRSPNQMAELIYDKLKFKELRRRSGPIRNKPNKAFPDGVPKTDEKTLAKLSATNEQQRRFLVLRKEVGRLNAELTKTLEFFVKICEEKGGTFFGVFNQTVTATHRLSSSGRKTEFEDGTTKGIQLQNMPRKYKDLIGPKVPGNKIGDADGSQLEFRGAAFLGRDVQAKYNIREDVDQHAFTAQQLFGYTTEEWEDLDKLERKVLRQDGKPETFKPLYGGSKGTPEQERYYTAFREMFPDLANEQKAWTFEVLRNKSLKMPWGMEWYWPYATQSHDGYISNTPSIYNYPIQNLATAEIIPVALAYTYHRCKHIDDTIRLFNTVHDSVTAEFPPGASEKWQAICFQTFTLDVYSYLEQVYDLDFDVPLGVGVSIGDRWEAPGSYEIELNVERDGSYWEKGKKHHG